MQESKGILRILNKADYPWTTQAKEHSQGMNNKNKLTYKQHKNASQ